MAAKHSIHPALAMALAPQHGNCGEWVLPRPQAPLTMRVQTATEAHDDVGANPEQANLCLTHGMDLEIQDDVLYRMDRLVQDLLASRKSLEDEKRKAADKDVEIAQLKQEVASLRDRAREEGHQHEAVGARVWELERVSVLNSTNHEEVNGLQQLLAFHKTHGEQASKRVRELQATNKDLETQLQITETALQEQMSLLSGLGICARAGDSGDSQEQAALVRMEGATLD